MTFYILANQVAALFLSLGLVTTLTFDSEITSYIYGGGESEIFATLTSDNKTLALKPKKEHLESNLLVQTRNGNFYFDLKATTPSEAHKFVDVRRGRVDKVFRELVNSEPYEIWEGEKSILFKNKSKKVIEVNGVKVSDNFYFSKGVPLFVNGQRVQL